MVMPAGDFISDTALEEEVHCERCDESVIKMFKDDHVCDERKLKAMVSNRRGEFAEPLVIPGQPKKPLRQRAREGPERARVDA